MPLAQPPEPLPNTIEGWLTRARRLVEVDSDELAEARKRRDAILSALRAEFAGSRTYVNGSVAHGDALTPLTDVDLGVVVREVGYGPDGKGPLPLMERARDAIRERLKADYPKLHVTVEGQHRAILVRFGDPVTSGEPDFTADVIVALDNPSAAGLFIPNLPEDWDRSHPEQHTRLVLAAIEESAVAFAHVVRLVKAWNRLHGKPLCSWNIKALALGCVTAPTTQVAGMLAWFNYGIAELAQHLTADPAGVALDPIPLNVTKDEVLAHLRSARGFLESSVAHEAAGRPLNAQAELGRLLPDLIPAPDARACEEEAIAQLKSDGMNLTSKIGAATLLAPITSEIKPRSWAP